MSDVQSILSVQDIAVDGAPGLDKKHYRDGMSRVGSAVHIVTTGGKAGRAGFTATAVTSVSDDPATLLVCLNATSKSLPVLTGNGVFCVNALAGDDAALADAFAGRTGIYGEARFAALEAVWAQLVTGSPVLGRALVAFDCRLIEATRVATHHVLMGKVVGISMTSPGSGLIYKDRGYHQL
jgi:flavin reductase